MVFDPDMMEIKRFKDRAQAGALLAKRLHSYAKRADVVVVALPRGGVPVGYAIAQALELPLDIMLVRKLGMPGHEEYAMGAIASGGLCVLQPAAVGALAVPPEVIEAVAQRELKELERREKLYRVDHPPLPLQGRVAILVDDGLATGATMLAALRAVHQMQPAYVVMAVPVAARDSFQAVASEADEAICLYQPEPFYAVGRWYENFGKTSDDDVRQLLDDAARVHAKRQSTVFSASRATKKIHSDARSK